MKAKDAHNMLKGYGGDDLYKKASELYALEIDQLVHIRSHRKEPTAGVVESSIKQVTDWFRKVSEGLAWSSDGIPKNIIEWENGEAFIRYNVMNPKLKEWGKRTRSEVMKGSPFPMLEAMKPGDLEAAGSMMMAMVRRDVKRWGEVHDRREQFAEQYGLRLCSFGAEERHCEHQTTYVLDKGELPTSTDDLVFVCDVDKCVKEENDGVQP